MIIFHLKTLPVRVASTACPGVEDAPTPRGIILHTSSPFSMPNQKSMVEQAIVKVKVEYFELTDDE